MKCGDLCVKSTRKQTALMISRLTLLLFAAFFSTVAFAQTEITIRDGDLEGNMTYNWTSDNTYILDGLVFLESGGRLNIEPGTVIKALSQDQVTTGDNTSALIIARNAQIFAEGTAANPIIFTAEEDDTTDPNDLGAVDRGLWGGLIVLGNATIANSDETDNIEGISANESRAVYGGTNDQDNSGVLRYISIRHGGAQLSTDNEINGLTLGAVGSGTDIDFVEVFANLDDGIEWFGGTVDVKNATVAFCGDDAFDYDQGWRGRGQFWFAIQAPNTSTGRSGEHDGATPDNVAPFSNPTIYNATYIGIGENGVATGGDANREGRQQSVVFRDNAGGAYRNSLFTGFNQRAIAIEDRPGEDVDSYQRFLDGDLVLENNLFENFGAGNMAADLFNAINQDEEIIDGASNDMVISMLGSANEIGASGIANVGRAPGGNLDPRIDAGGAALGGAAEIDEDINSDGFFNLVTYRGAFGNRINWLEQWTALAEYGYLGNEVEEVDNFNCIVIRDEDLVGGQTYNWTSNNCYTLDGLVFLEADGVLNIEAGTVIRGLDADRVSTGDNTSALIITRDAQIFANGNAQNPVIFTAADDDTEVPDDFTSRDRGEWGGLIILGNATIANSDPTDNIEGIAATETRAVYGGNDDEDNSGVLRYVSIRHGGAQLSADNEINGLTLGGVGSGTTIEYVDVFANLDDGIEWFGGTVDVSHATVAFCGDDAMDYDQGWRGRGQFWFVMQEPNTSTGRSGEHDGATPDNATPPSTPTIYNATYIGIGEGNTATGGDANREGRQQSVVFRDNAGGQYRNSLFTDFNQRAIAIEDRPGEDLDSYQRFVDGELVIENNLFEDFGAGDTPADIFNAIDQNEAIIDGPSNDNVVATLGAANEIGASGIANISREPNNMLDPRIDAGGAALSGGVPNDGDEFFQLVSYRGAFNNSTNWLEGWTALSDMNYLGDLVEEQDDFDCIVIRDEDLVGGQTYNWTSANCYTLDGLVFLEADGVLNIEAGTVIRGLDADRVTTGDNTSALIIARDATINATGTANDPIIFTAADDDLNDPDDFTSVDRGEWGGLIILGNATIANSDPTDNIEGIAATETRAIYGGSDDEDNSGILRYISIRHGGAQLSADNEINGLTLGAVGSGTEIDFVEVFANLDDGIEWFGGTVTVDHAAVSFCGDDAYDYDQGWRGGGQFWYSLQGPGTSTGRAGEHDGATPDNAPPFAQPLICNATYVGIGADQSATGGDANREGRQQAVIFRDNAAGSYNNSIFTDFNGSAIAIEDRDGDDVDSWARYQAGDLELNNNIFWSFGFGETAADLFTVVNPDEEVQATQSGEFATAMTNAGNRILDPKFIDADRDMAGGDIDPRPNEFCGSCLRCPRR
jgi:hypothetical protein